METHTLVLQTERLAIPEEITIDFVINLISKGVANAEYFGPEIDNPEHYVDDTMTGVKESTSYIEFHFDTVETIYYESLTKEEVDKLIYDKIKKSANIELRADEKDITVYL